MSTDGEPIKGPELDDMVCEGIKGLVGCSLLSGTEGGAANMLGPQFGGPVAVAAKWDMNATALQTASDMTRKRENTTPSGPKMDLT